MSASEDSLEAGRSTKSLLEALANTYSIYEATNTTCPDSVLELIQEQLDKLYDSSKYREKDDAQVVADEVEELADLADVLGCRQTDGLVPETCSFPVLQKMFDQRVEDMRALMERIGDGMVLTMMTLLGVSEEELLLKPLGEVMEKLKGMRHDSSGD
ncbi:MAG: hypothetical protein Q9200_004616 [Gallowayella weberi]